MDSRRIQEELPADHAPTPQPLAEHPAVGLISDWARRHPLVQVAVGQHGMILAFAGKPKSVGWAEVDYRAGTFVVRFNKLKGYPPFIGKGRTRIVNTFRNTLLWRSGESTESPALTLDQVVRKWTTIQNHLDLIVSEVRG